MDAIIMGKKISELRKSKGLTQKDLASKVSVTNKAVSKWERGLNFPDIALISDLADELGVTAAELLDDGKNTNEDLISDISKLSKKEKKVSRRKIIASWLVCALIIAFVILMYNVYERDKLYDDYNNQIDSLKDEYMWFETDLNRLLEGDKIEFEDFSYSFARQLSAVQSVSKQLVKLDDINRVPGYDISKASPYDNYYGAFFGIQNLYNTAAKRYYLDDSELTDNEVRIANSIYTNGIMDFALMTKDVIEKADLGLEIKDEFALSKALDGAEEYANWDELNAKFTKWTGDALKDAGFSDMMELPEGTSLSYLAEGGCIEKDGLGNYAAVTEAGVRHHGFYFDHFINYHGHIYKDYNDIDFDDLCSKMDKAFGVKADPEKIQACFEASKKKGKNALKKDDNGLTHKSLITYRDELQRKDGELTDTVCLYCDCILGYIDDGADLKYRIRLVRTRGDYSE